ncbi:lipopolysaccharide biosynthesis protein [Clostridium paraputrificum]|uniref:lipopolysaccharide biosynthesis protein n=1 Tax=Clostridium paraputrificum TaxID=29363 RepID=UPI00374F2344
MIESRVNKFSRNAIFVLLAYIFRMICSFIVRTIFIKTLSSEYLGLNGLFTNILSILSLAELGIGNAISFSLYKPLKENDTKKVSEYMNYFKRTYRILALLILILGISIMPFLSYIFGESYKVSDNLYFIYSLYLIKTVVSYLLVYKTTLLIADQNQYITSIVNIVYQMLLTIGQVLILVLFKNFILFIMVEMIATILQNVVNTIICNKKYSYLKKSRNTISSKEKRNLHKDIFSAAIYKVSGVVISHTDNLILTKFVSVIIVGIYSNYYLIIHSIMSLIKFTLSSITSSLGNYYVNSDGERTSLVYNSINMISAWLFGLAAVGLYVCLEDFMIFWAGEEYLLSKNITLILIVNFYLLGITEVYNIFRNSFGLFQQAKFIPIFSSAINLVCSLVFVNLWGTIGVFFGTTCAYILINFWLDPYIVHKYSIKCSPKKYIIRSIGYIMIIVIIGYLTKKLCNLVCFNNLFFTIIVKVIITIIIYNCIFYGVLYRTKEFSFIKQKVSAIIKK